MDNLEVCYVVLAQDSVSSLKQTAAISVVKVLSGNFSYSNNAPVCSLTPTSGYNEDRWILVGTLTYSETVVYDKVFLFIVRSGSSYSISEFTGTSGKTWSVSDGILYLTQTKAQSTLQVHAALVKIGRKY